MGKAIGIDLGTTNSCVCIVDNGRPVIIPNENGKRTTPSVVAFAKDGSLLVGETALNQAIVNRERTVTSIKRQMGTDWRFQVDGRSMSPQEISAIILRKLKEDAQRYLGESVTDAVITVPAYFNDIQRQATKDAGRIAGMNVLRIINEPTSAALAYGLNNGQSQKIMVFDLGGGTFDVSIIEIGDNVIEVLATNGDNHLGGDDFDQVVLEHLLDEIKRQHGLNLRSDVAALQRIREAAENAKKELSSDTSTVIRLPYLAQKGSETVNFEYTLTREKFNQLTRSLVERTAVPVQNALTDAGIAASELGKVLLVGGSTRMPSIQDKVRELTGLEPSKTINPDECVAQGAAIQAQTLSGNALTVSNGQGILLLDVTPLSLSIETVGGVATRLVERNTTLPVHYSQIFTTAAPYQRNVEIHVLQGERPMAGDNKTIGRFMLNGIKAAPAGVPQIEVTFDIDANGILKVSAMDLDTRRSQSITITENGKMSEEEIQRAIHDAQMNYGYDQSRRNAFSAVSEASVLVNKVENALARAGSRLDKEEKKTVREDCSNLRHLVSKAKPQTMGDDEIAAIREATSRLQSSSANVISLSQGPEPEKKHWWSRK